MIRGLRGLLVAGTLQICVSLSADEPATAPPNLIVAPHGGSAELRIVEVGGNESRVVAAGVARPIFPSRRASSRQLAFSSDASGHSQIYALDLTAGIHRNLTNTPSNEYQPVYSPDGGTLLFTSDGGRLMLLDTEAGTTSEFAGAPRVTASRMVWRPGKE